MTALDTVTMPPSIARLPRNKVGYPIPWFVATLDDGSRDFRIAGGEQAYLARTLKLCWICGGALGAYGAFTIGPMCAVNRVSAEPPAHRACAIYSAMVCPFLSVPSMRRREAGKPDDLVEAAGVSLRRNPGVALVWVSRRWQHFQPDRGAPGWLCDVGDPTETLWYCEGRAATRDEVLASIRSGLPLLEEVADGDARPAAARKYLAEQVEAALKLVPAGAR